MLYHAKLGDIETIVIKILLPHAYPHLNVPNSLYKLFVSFSVG